jgi:hypothetical protein
MEQDHIRTRLQNKWKRGCDHIQEKVEQMRSDHQRMQKLTARAHLSLQERRCHLGYGKFMPDLFTGSSELL